MLTRCPRLDCCPTEPHWNSCNIFIISRSHLIPPAGTARRHQRRGGAWVGVLNDRARGLGNVWGVDIMARKQAQQGRFEPPFLCWGLQAGDGVGGGGGGGADFVVFHRWSPHPTSILTISLSVYQLQKQKCGTPMHAYGLSALLCYHCACCLLVLFQGTSNLAALVS